MDVNKYVVLHNKILEHGWVHSGRSREDLERDRKAWFDYHGDEAEAIRGILSPDIIAFVERAYEVDCEDGHAFFYYVAGLFFFRWSMNYQRPSITTLRRTVYCRTSYFTT